MRPPLNCQRKAEGVFGIRSPIWLVVLGLVLFCVLIICRAHREPRKGALGPEKAVRRLHRTNGTPRLGFVRISQMPHMPLSHALGIYGDGEVDLLLGDRAIHDRDTWLEAPTW